MSFLIGSYETLCIFAYKYDRTMKSLLSTNNLRAGAGWLFLVVGLMLYFVGFFCVDNDSIESKIAIKIADVLVIGVVLGFITNAAQFIGIFKKDLQEIVDENATHFIDLFKHDLQDVVCGKEFVKQRKDIYPLWKNLSKELFKNKFPTLHEELLKTVNGYLPKNEVSYYNDYEIHTSIEWIDKGKGIIKATDNVQFDLICETTDSIDYPIKTWTNITDKHEYKNTITQITVNGKAPEPNKLTAIKEKRESDGSLCQEQCLVLQGSTTYEIKYTREKTYNFNDDYYVGFRAKYIVSNLRVCLDLPDGISAIFICRGTQKDFDDVNNNNKNRIEKRYRGIVLPRQGYIFALKHNQI